MSLTATLTIDLDAIVANWRALDALSAPQVETAAVVKADAYGCGANEVGPALARAGARTFFVAIPEEGQVLRQAIGHDPTIYVLGGFPEGGSPLYAAQDLRPVLNSGSQAVAWFKAHPDRPCAIQLDTGMNRLGLEVDEFASLGALPECVDLIMSHMGCADDPTHPMNASQLAEFERLTTNHSQRRSLSATAGILLGADYHFDLTRIGIGLYGGWPFTDAKAVATIEAPIIQIRHVATGESLGYGATWTASRKSRIATISAGYADGMIRAMGNGCQGYIKGQPASFAGRVSMDLITLDVTDCDCAPGDAVELLGPNQTIDDLAASAGTIGHEILTSLGTRYTRRYNGGK